jgi:hypothetical protein
VDREYPVDKPDDALRVALLGDSFTASEYLHTGQKFEGLLEDGLTRELGRPVEILNFAISGSETWDHLQLLHLKALKYQPDVVFLAFYWGNDVKNNIEQLRAGNPNPLEDEYDAPLAARIKAVRKDINKWLWNHSLLYQVIHDGTGRLELLVKRWRQPEYLERIDRIVTGDAPATKPGVTTLAERPAADTAASEDDTFFWDSAGWELTRALILRLRDDAQAAGSRLVVLHFPSVGMVLSGIPLPDAEFDAFLTANGIPYVSLFPGYRTMDPEELQRHAIPGDGHWTPEGHRYAAGQGRAMLHEALGGS